MSNIVNMDRDMFWADNTALVSAVGGDLASASLNVGNSGAVGQRFAAGQSDAFTITVGSDLDVSSFGVLILAPPEGDICPYRFKGSIVNDAGNRSVFGYGYLAGGTGTSVDQVHLISCSEFVDEVVAIPPLSDVDDNFGDPL